MSMFLYGCSQFIPRTSPEELQAISDNISKSKIIVLDIYSNNCESCKHIEPIIEKLKSNYSQDPDIAFLKYDLSNPFTAIDSKKIAKKIGIEEICNSQQYTGVVLFIDSKTKQVLKTLTAEYDIQKYIEIINKVVGNA